jgi:hypothetical protein
MDVTGRAFAGKILKVGPVTTNPEIQVLVENQGQLPEDRLAYTDNSCRTSRTQSPTNPDLRREECI